MPIIRARVPSRIDFLGGGTDAPPFCIEHGGAVINASVSRYVTCTIELGADIQGVEIYSRDFDQTVRAASVEALEFDGHLDLIKAGVKRSGLSGAFRMVTEMDLPPQSGLGASGALNVAVIAACLRAQNKPIEPMAVIEEANLAERIDLGLPGGSQDACSAAFGGVNCFEFKGKEINRIPLELTREQLAELEHRLFLVYTGVSHVSGNIHADIKKDYADDNSPCKKAMFALKDLGYQGLDLLRRGDLKGFGRALSENWKYHKDLHASCTNDHLNEIFRTAEQIGIVGAKTCGAGGGGCVVFYCAEGKKTPLYQALRKLGCEPMHFTFDMQGIVTWAVE